MNMLRRTGQTLALPFLPALCFFPVWFTIGIREDMFRSSFSNYYPMMMAMVIGSMIAGSTPLGGGVVAFPVSVLILGFSPDQGRDFSLLIQSVGMTAASYLIFVKKRHLLKEGTRSGNGDLLPKFCVLSIIGMIIGFEQLDDVLSPFIVNVVYTTTVTCIVIVLAYVDFLRRKNVESRMQSGDEEQRKLAGSSSVDSYDHEEQGVKMDSTRGSALQPLLNYFVLPIFALAGGILSSQIGTGADIACYSFGSLYNDMVLSSEPKPNSSQKNDKGMNIACTNGHSRISDNALTAMSVIVMANTSIFGSILRISTTEIPEDLLDPSPSSLSLSPQKIMDIDKEVFSVLFACAPIVVLGAPIGSMLLTPTNQVRLKQLFYALGIAQFVSFGIIKIGDDVHAWLSIGSIISFVCFMVLLHHRRRVSTDTDADYTDDSTMQVTSHSRTAVPR